MTYLKLVFLAFFLSGLVFAADGFEDERSNRQAESVPADDGCGQPPVNRRGETCCLVPKERVWGDLSQSFKSCFGKIREQAKARWQAEKGQRQGRGDRRSQRQETFESGENPAPDNSTPDNEERPGEQNPPPPPPPPTTPEGPRDDPEGSEPPRRPGGKKHFFRHRRNDGCLMECVFQEQGFISENKVNKAALLDRLETTLKNEPEWYDSAVSAVNKCSGTAVEANRTCQSGSDESFRCIFKEMYLTCPSWQESSYCTELQGYLKKCGNSDKHLEFLMQENHRRHHHHHHHHHHGPPPPQPGSGPEDGGAENFDD